MFLTDLEQFAVEQECVRDKLENLHAAIETTYQSGHHISKVEIKNRICPIANALAESIAQSLESPQGVTINIADERIKSDQGQSIFFKAASQNAKPGAKNLLNLLMVDVGFTVTKLEEYDHKQAIEEHKRTFNNAHDGQNAKPEAGQGFAHIPILSAIIR